MCVTCGSHPQARVYKQQRSYIQQQEWVHTDPRVLRQTGIMATAFGGGSTREELNTSPYNQRRKKLLAYLGKSG